MARANEFRRSVQVFISRELSPAAQGRAFLDVTKARVDALIASGEAAPSYSRTIDGVRDAPDSAARVPGVIAYLFDNIGQAVVVAIPFLQNRSPVKSGAYRSGFRIGIDGRIVTAAQFQPSLAVGAREILIWNVEPYGRKVDVQIEGTRHLRFSVEPMILQDTVTMLSRRFGNSLAVKRLSTIAVPSPWTRRTGRDQGRKVDYPAIQITRR